MSLQIGLSIAARMKQEMKLSLSFSSRFVTFNSRALIWWRRSTRVDE